LGDKSNKNASIRVEKGEINKIRDKRKIGLQVFV